MPDTTIAVRRTLAVAAPECSWGHVRVWDAPRRVVLTWQISATWQQPDRAATSGVDVRFSAAGGARTLVELDPRGLQTYAERAEEMPSISGSDQGWSGLLARFTAAAGRPGPRTQR